MGLNLKNAAVERLAEEVAHLADETKTEAIRKALLERKARLHAHGREAQGRRAVREFLERNIWTTVPTEELGRTLTGEEEDRILGYGPEGV